MVRLHVCRQANSRVDEINLEDHCEIGRVKAPARVGVGNQQYQRSPRGIDPASERSSSRIFGKLFASASVDDSCRVRGKAPDSPAGTRNDRGHQRGSDSRIPGYPSPGKSVAQDNQRGSRRSTQNNGRTRRDGSDEAEKGKSPEAKGPVLRRESFQPQKKSNSSSMLRTAQSLHGFILR